MHRDGWHQGVIGIVASRLADAFCRPAVVLAGEAGLYRGSSRSFGDFDMLGAITNAAEYAFSFGGHRKACGMLVEEAQIGAFRDKINEFAEQHLDPGRSRPFARGRPETGRVHDHRAERMGSFGARAFR